MALPNGESSYASELTGQMTRALRHAVLLAARDGSTLLDRLDCAELALTSGLHDTARSIYEMIFIQTGFAPSQRAWQREIVTRTGLWSITAPLAAEPVCLPERRFSVDIALDELKPMIAQDASHFVALDWRDAVEKFAERVQPATCKAAAPTDITVVKDAGAAVEQLYGLLSQPADASVDATLTQLLDGLRGRLANSSAVDVRAHVGNTEAMVATMLWADLQRFIQANHNLAFPPFGSAALLHATARLEFAALGPYLRNVSQLVRTSRDIPAMVDLAASDCASQTRDRWMVLLTTYIDEAMLLDLVDELGDRDLIEPLWMMLYVVIGDLPRLRTAEGLSRIRDAALDNADFRLGVCAQRVITAWMRDSAVEWAILGEIHLTAGNLREARRAFVQGLRATGRATHLRDRLGKLRAGDVEDMRVLGGYKTPKNRQQLRLARRRVAAD